MPAVYPSSLSVFHDYVDLEELGMLVSRSPTAIMVTLKRYIKTRSVRTLYRPGTTPLTESIPVYNIHDLSKVFSIPDSYVEEILLFRRQAGEVTIEIPVPESLST